MIIEHANCVKANLLGVNVTTSKNSAAAIVTTNIVFQCK